MDERQTDRLTVVRSLLAEPGASLAAYVEDIHPADLADVVQQLTPEERAGFLDRIPETLAAAVLEELEPREQSAILLAMDEEKAADVIDEMSDDTLADLIGEVPREEALDLLDLMEAQGAADVRELLVYPEDTAGGLMTTEFVALPADMSVANAIEHLRRTAPDAETIYYVYVVDRAGMLVGVLSLRDLIVADPDRQVGDIARREVIAVEATADQEDVARLVSKYDLLAVPVTERGKLLGIVTVDDVIDVIQEEATEDIYRLAANTTPERREFAGTPWHRAKKRLPWLVALLFGELVSGNVIQLFSHTLEVVTFLAVFITVMSGEAGNVATQSLAVVVRVLATGDIGPRQVWLVVAKETLVGVVVGLVGGGVLALTALLWHHQPWLGLLVGVALAMNMTVAAILGSFFPVVIERLGIDPAVASGPFITTLTDVISMLIYFELATLFISHLA